MAAPENTQLIGVALRLYRQYNRSIEALRCCIMINDLAEIKKCFKDEQDELVAGWMILFGVYLQLSTR